MNNNFTAHARIGVLFFCLFLSFCANAQAPYCLPTYDRDCNAGDGFGTAISQFTLKRGTTTLISDATGCNTPDSYIHFTTTTPSVTGGSTYAFDIAFVKPDDGGGAPIPIDAGYAIWIDLNNNNTFENTEIVASGLAAESGTITIPSGTTVGNHRMRIRANRSAGGGFPSPALPTDPCTLQDMGDTHDYTLNVITCPTITDSTSIRLNVTCVANNNGQFQFVGKGGIAPYTFTLGKITGNETNTTGLFTGLGAKDYRLTITDANGCTGSSVRTIESYTDLSALNNSMLAYDWLADSLPTVGTGLQYDYLTSPTAAFKINGDSLAKYNQGNANAMSKYIPLGFSFKMDNFYYDSLVISEDGVISFNKNINTTDISSQWYQNEFYTGLNTYTSPSTGDCQCDTAYLNNPLPFIAPFRDDMQTNASGNVASKIQYQISGTAPNRVFTVEWRNMRWNRVCNIQRDNSVSFQVELHEGTNNVRFRYKPEPNLKTDNCGGTPLGNFATVTGYNYSAGLFGRRLGGGNYIALNPDSSKLFTNAPNVVGSGASTVLYRGVKTDNLNFPADIKYPIGKHYQLTAPTVASCIDPLSIVSVEASCSSGSDGTITIVATGGLPRLNSSADKRYYYSKDGGKTFRLGTLVNVGTTYQDTFRNLAPGTYYIAVMDNQIFTISESGSLKSQSFIIQTIVVPSTKVTSQIIQPITCNGGSDGQIRLRWAKTSDVGSDNYTVEFQKTGGTLQTFTHSTTDTTRLFTGLNAGTYNVTVTFNDLGCTTTATATLTDPSVLDVVSTVTQPICPSNATAGTKTGGFSLSVSGGTSPYTFTLPSGLTASSSTATSRNFINLAAGTYVITVTDGAACSVPKSITITNPTNYAINNIVTTPPTCNGGTNGSASFNVTGGAAATFNSIVFSSSPNQTFSSIAKGTTVSPVNLRADNYNVSITEGTCTYNVSSAVSVAAPSAVTFTSGTPMSPTCNGGSNGQIVIVVSGGTPSYMYSIDNGMNYQTGATFTGLTSGNYTLKAKDANGCFSVTTPSVTITNPTAVSILSIAKNNVLCKGASTGLIQVTGSNGTGTYQYSKDGGMNYQSGNQFTGLAAGNYDIRIKDGNNCESAIQIVNVSEPATNVSFTTAVTDATCAVPTGSIQVTASNGTGVYQFSKDNGATYTTGTPSNPYTFTGLAINSYQIKVKDGNNCAAATQKVDVGGSANATITMSNQVNALCNGGSTGSFRATVSGGSTPYTVVMKNASNTTIAGTGSNPYDYTGLAAGTYTVSVTDGASCVTTQNVMITQANALAFNETSKTDATCGSSNGSITFNITGGGTTYATTTVSLGMTTIQTFSGGTTGTVRALSSLAAGTYSVVVTDNNTCTASFSFTIAGQSSIVINSITPVDATCKGGTGSLTVSASGGTGGLTYSVDGTNFQMSASFPNLTPQAYTVLVKDGSGCTAAQSFAINEPNAVTFKTSKVDVLCNGAATGSITVTASGGTGAFMYSKDGGMNYQSGNSFTGLIAATYSIKVKDANNCLSVSFDIEVTQPTPLSMSINSQTNVACFGGSTGAVTLLASGGNSTSYTYRKDAMTSNATGIFTGLAAGTYVFTVTDANSCTKTQSVTITEPTAISVSITLQTNVLCKNGTTGAVTLSASGGNSTSYSYRKDAMTSNATGVFTGLSAGTYVFTTTDANSCTTTKSVQITEPINPLSIGSVSTTPATCSTGGTVTITGTSGGTGAYTFKLTSSLSNGTGSFTNVSGGNYMLTVTDANNCESTTSVSVGNSAAPKITVTGQTDILCNGGTTGAFTFSVSGGTGAYTVSVKDPLNATVSTTGANPYSTSGLAAGTYSISVTDGASCSTSQNVMLTQPTASLSISVNSQTNVACFGASTGAVTLVASGGNSTSYSYRKDAMTSNSTGIFTNLTAGTYIFTVTDANSCTKTQSVTITEPTAISVSITLQTNVLCKNGTTGAVTLSASGGNSTSYSYRKDAMTSNATGVFTGLSAGTYVFTITDANTCTTTKSVQITEPINPLSIGSVSTTPATCSTGGTVSVTGTSGGTGAYTFKLTSSLSNGTGSFTNVSGGNYMLTVTDANNCESTTSVSVGNSAAPKITVGSTTNIPCNGASTGGFSFSIVGGTGAYTVVVKDAFNNTITITGSYTASNLAAGTYTISVTDAASCSTSETVTLTEPTPLSISVNSQTNVACFGASTGAVTLVASGGNSTSYSYRKDAMTSNSTGIFTGLSAGTYIFTVTDANSCTKTQSVTITEPTVLTASIAGTTTVCQNSIPVPNLTFMGGGGVAPYTFTYKINGGIDQTITTSMGNSQMLSQSSAMAGTFAYTLVKIKDANNCEVNVSGSATITVSALPTAAIGCTKRLCPTTPSGTTAVFDLTTLESCVTGGVMGVSVTWFSDAALMNPITTPLSFTTGSTAVYAKIALGSLPSCYSVASPTLFVNPVITVSTSKSNVTTNGGSNGSILVTGGGGFGALQFSKDGGMTYVSNMTSQYSFTGLTATTYQIRVKDGFGCESANTAVQITEPSAVSFTTEVTDVKCNGGSDGSIKVTASNGVAPYEFSKDDGATFTTMAANPFIFTGLSATSYKIKVKDATATITAATTVSVGQPTTPLSISVNSQQNKDCSNSTGSVTLLVGGGTGSLQVSLDGMNFQNGLTFNNLAATNYIGTVKDANNCTKTVGFTIADNGTLPPTPNAISNRSICNGEMTTLTPSATGVTTFKFYDSNPTIGSPTPLSTGASYSYMVSATKTFWITSVNSLCASAPIQTTVTKFDCAKIGDPCLCKNNATTLTNGQFDETVEVSAPAGQTWTVTAITGLYSMSSAAPPAAPTLISIGATMTYNVGLARYLLNGIHIDGIGYSVTVSNGMGTTLSIGNQCWYPNPSITTPLSISACSSDPTITLAGSAQLGNGGGAATGVGSFMVDAAAATSINPATIGIGNHTITYSFDAADNVPTAAHPGCIQAISQTIGILGTPTIISTANLLDNNTIGQCGKIITYNSSSTGTPAPTITYELQGATIASGSGNGSGSFFNVGTTKVILSATNSCGTGTYTFNITINDTEKPMITCPTNQVINLPSRACSAAVTFADATATDNCGAITPSRTDATGVMSGDVLRYGTYNLTYKAVDASNNMSTCSFSIQINQFVPQGDLVCYGDVNLTASPTCFTRIKPEMLLSSESGCIDNYRVEVYTLGGTVLATPVLDASHIGKRFKVAVIDPSGNICWGYLNYEDKTAPEIICPSTASISCADIGSNGAPLSSLTGEPNVFLECSPTTTTYNDQNFDVPCGVTLTAAPVGFPVGVAFDVNGAVNAKRVIVRTFTVKDRYNNFSTCKQVIYVNRLKTFTTICPPPVTVVCVQNTLRTAPTDTTINGVLVLGTGIPTFSNGLPIASNVLCTAAASFTDIQVGNTIVRSWAVATVCGDMTMCTQRITVNPTGATCTTLRPMIAGTIRRLNGDNVPTTVILSSNGDSLSSQTDAVFAFNSLITNRNYTVTPRRPNTDWTKGVTTLDVALVSRHVLDIAPFTSPYTIIAADADRDGDISGVDMLLLQQLILRRRSALPNNNSWRFVSKNYNFLDPTNPLAEPFEETANFSNLTTNANADFVAIKTGDVNQSATMLRDGSTGQVEIRGARQPFVLPVDDIVLEKNKTYTIPIRLPNDGKTGPSVSGSKNDVQALQFTLNIDKNAADITALSNGNAPDFNDNNLGFFKKEGIVTAAWYRKDNQTVANTDTLTLFNLTIKVSQTTRLSEIMSLNSTYTEGVAYDASGQGMPVQLSFSNQKQASAKAFLLPNRPNPFNSETILAFNLPEAGVAKLTVCDLLGKVMMTTERTFDKGINEVLFNADRSPSLSTGIFVVRLQTASGVAEQRIVLSR